MESPKDEALQRIRKIYDIDQLLYGQSYVREMIRSLAETLEVKYVLVGHAIEPDRRSIQTDFVWSAGSFSENVIYQLHGTPCVEVICGTRASCYADNVAELFPEDHMLKDLGARSYVGAPFFNPEGNLTGLLVVLDDKPLKERELFSFVAEFFAARIGTEYRRQAFEDSLQREVKARTIELTKAFSELQRTQRQLVAQEKLATIGRITFGIAHELKNPLNVIINGSEILQDMLNEMGASEEAKHTAAMIRQQGERANFIITSMLRQAREQPENAESENINVSDMVERALEMSIRSLSDLDFKSKIEIELDIDKLVELKIVDSSSLERAFINLIDNSLYALKKKFRNGPAGFAPRLAVVLRQRENGVDISILDNGTGIPETVMEKIFDEFYTTKPAGEGTGLGMSMARQIVCKNGGDIFVSSREGEYTEVVVHFPSNS